VKRLAVLGQPVAHSLSPAMHSAALEEMGLAGEWSYEAIEVSPRDFESVVRALPEAGFVGANVTIPHKEAALALADAASETARAIGAANTLTFAEGRIKADNTDAPGLILALPRSPRGLSALVLGAGGAGRSAAWALADAGAEVSVWNRTAQRAQDLAQELGVRAFHADPRDGPMPIDAFEILVNATSVGMKVTTAPQGNSLKGLNLLYESFRKGQLVVDLAYAESETELGRAARARGAHVVDGREVLVRQGAASLQIWTGESPPLEKMREAISVTPQGRKDAGDGAGDGS
jgi:shikimate dehydrogenase